KACVLPENPASYRVVRTKSYLFNKAVMRYILDGKDNNDIAEKMFISNKTVSTYKSRLMEKLECKSLMDLYTFAQRNKIG
ncbi:LuxR C-terminal-related transcriptional regulator, partial [Escherichia coli]